MIVNFTDHLVVNNMNMKRAYWLLSVILTLCAGKLQAQTASFNFSNTSHPVSGGWINVFGDPSVSICTGTSSGITVSSVATGNWSSYNGSSAFDAGGAANGTFFPPGVMLNHWYQYGSPGQYNSSKPQLLLSGLNKDSVYTIRMTGSFSQNIGFFELNPIRYTVTGAVVYGYIDVNGDNNTSNGAVFYNVTPDVSGNVKVYINTYGSSNIASICGIQVMSGRSSAPAQNYFWSTTGNIATGGDTSFVGTVDTNRLAFRTNNIERMSILGDGTIGIGTKNTYGYKLAVNGNAIFGKVRIKTVGTWPDYVFKKGYVLKSLEDLEFYIEKYEHLPGIIAEPIANVDGVDLGTHQSALLKKIEELTLYLIRENKTLKEQNQRITEQNIKLEDQQRQIDELKRLIKAK